MTARGAGEPSVSVVVPNYNYARYLGTAIESVLAQTHAARELIVVDDGSTDDSLSVLAGFGAAIHVVRQQNRGVSAARNAGIAAGDSELVAFLDADDAWRPTKLERQIEVLRARPDVGLVYCGLEYTDGTGRPTGADLSGATEDVLEAMVLMRTGILGLSSTAVVRRSCLARVGGFEDRLSTAADWDLGRRIACHYPVAKVAAALVEYRQHGRNIHRGVSLMQRDMLLALERTFADPAAARVHGLRRRSYAALFSVLAGSYLHAGDGARAIACLCRAGLLWPPAALHGLSLPLRALRRRLSSPGSAA